MPGASHLPVPEGAFRATVEGASVTVGQHGRRRGVARPSRHGHILPGPLREGCVRCPTPRSRRQLGGLGRVVELGAVAGALDLDPLGPRELDAEAGPGGGEGQDLVVGAPDEADRTGDSLRVEPPALALGEGDEGSGSRAAAPRIRWATRSAERWSALLA